ncbi:MAG: hypothetical protein QOF83_88 [Solirubrobacteraceae bacterium]|jgi:hypothetical protein|nr:hypothetical protein [Solirubrobacteraceae bacterium]
MNPEQQLSYEARVRDRQSKVALAAGILLVVAFAMQALGPHAKVSEFTVELLNDSHRSVLNIIGAVLNGAGYLALAWTVSFLQEASRARNPVRARRWVGVTAWVGAGLVALCSLMLAIVVALKEHQFATTGAQTYAQANSLMSSPLLTVLQVGALLGNFVLALPLVLMSLNALQNGLLTKFLGYLGVFAGFLIAFPIFQVPIVQAYWLAAVAYLLSGRWPSGVPPAWSTGRAEPWPSAAETRARRAAGAGARSTPRPSPAPEPQTAGGPSAVRTRASTPKRKRKRRN